MEMQKLIMTAQFTIFLSIKIDMHGNAKIEYDFSTYNIQVIQKLYVWKCKN